MGDITARRGRVHGSSTTEFGEQSIEALVPSSELQRYAVDLRSITGGRGTYHMEYSHYDEVPAPLQTKIVAAHKAAHPHAGDHHA